MPKEVGEVRGEEREASGMGKDCHLSGASRKPQVSSDQPGWGHQVVNFTLSWSMEFILLCDKAEFPTSWSFPSPLLRQVHGCLC